MKTFLQNIIKAHYKKKYGRSPPPVIVLYLAILIIKKKIWRIIMFNMSYKNFSQTLLFNLLTKYVFFFSIVFIGLFTTIAGANDQEKKESTITISERISQVSVYYNSRFGIDVNPELPVISPEESVIAGEDNRKDYYELNENDVKEKLQKQLSDSTVLITSQDRLEKQQNGSYELETIPFSHSGFPPCSNERFDNQDVGGWCSGFLVGPDLIATAGHCVKTNDDATETAFIFGFKMISKDSQVETFTKNQVYFGKKLIVQELSDEGDYALIRLDRAVTAQGAFPLNVRRSGSVNQDSNVGVIGYPSGLPVKIAYGDNTKIKKVENVWLTANLDTYGGNSGSAVFNAKGLVEGILVRGAKDYNIDFGRQCFVSNRIRNSEGSEAVTKASVFVKHIPEE